MPPNSWYELLYHTKAVLSCHFYEIHVKTGEPKLSFFVTFATFMVNFTKNSPLSTSPKGKSFCCMARQLKLRVKDRHQVQLEKVDFMQTVDFSFLFLVLDYAFTNITVKFLIGKAEIFLIRLTA